MIAAFHARLNSNIVTESQIDTNLDHVASLSAMVSKTLQGSQNFLDVGKIGVSWGLGTRLGKVGAR